MEQFETYRSDRLDLSHSSNKVGSVTHWDAKIHESVFRDLTNTIPNKAHKLRALWALFDDTSLLGNMILKRLYTEIKKSD